VRSLMQRLSASTKCNRNMGRSAVACQVFVSRQQIAAKTFAPRKSALGQNAK